MPPARLDVVVLPSKRKHGRLGQGNQEREMRKEWEPRKKQWQFVVMKKGGVKEVPDSQVFKKHRYKVSQDIVLHHSIRGTYHAWKSLFVRNRVVLTKMVVRDRTFRLR